MNNINYSDVIDNKNKFLKDEINSILKATEEAKFAVGYLYLSGINEIINNLSHLKELKLIIGTVSDEKTIEEIAEGIARRDDFKKAMEELKYQKPTDRSDIVKSCKSNIGVQIGRLEQSEENEKILLSLKELIAKGIVKIRVYTKHRLHSKLYLFKYKREVAEQTRSEGIAILGSSNLTLSGFKQSTELNVFVRGNENYRSLDSWFNSLWDESVDFEKELLTTIDNSWALKYANPYDIYILTIYNLVQSKMKFRSNVIWDWKALPVSLYKFQKLAVMQAYEILNRYNGVFISDVVGLGKTFIGAALVKQLNKRAVIICPPRLINMWEEFGEKFKIDVKTISIGDLNNGAFNEDSKLWKYRDREVVLIDESHYFRNSDTKRYCEIQPFLIGKKVILITATPQNTSIWNIYHQVRLFNQKGSNDYQIKGGNLKEFFDLVEKKEANIQDLLSKILIRRTRKHIKKYYSQLGNESISFPKRELYTISYSIDQTYNNLYDEIEKALKELTYAKYNLWLYVKDEKKEESTYQDIKKVTDLLKGLHKVMLYKRLESSIRAFSETINRLKKIHYNFLLSLDEDIIPAGEESQDLIYDENFNINDNLNELREASKKYNAHDFKIKELKRDIEHDYNLLSRISNSLKKVAESNDRKFNELVKILDKHKGEKILIFSEYADTVKYLYGRLKDIIDRVSFVTSDTKETMSIIKRFAPKANQYELKRGELPIDVIISTDVFSAGLNLQDCGILINYDLHWNPVLLIQRAGRIDRIGSEHDIIKIYNFLPHKIVEEKISLKDRVFKRIQEIHDYIGEDSKILDESERLNEKALYAIYEKANIEDLEDSISEGEFNLDEAELLIEMLEREEPEYFNYIKNLQLGTRSIKKGINYKGVFAYLRKGNFNKLYIMDKEGTITSNIDKILSEIKCSKDEKTLTISEEDKKYIYTSLCKIEEKFKEDYMLSTDSATKKDPVIVKTIKKLVSFRNEVNNDHDIIIIDRIISSLNKDVQDEVVIELKRLEKEKLNIDNYLRKMIEIYNRYRIGDSEVSNEEERGYKQIETVCCELLK